MYSCSFCGNSVLVTGSSITRDRGESLPLSIPLPTPLPPLPLGPAPVLSGEVREDELPVMVSLIGFGGIVGESGLRAEMVGV